MTRKYVVWALAGGLLLLAAGCGRIHEPWVRSSNQLEQERYRPYQAQMVLRHRLTSIQTDR